MVKVEAQGQTDIGCVRKTNQDSYLVDLQNQIFVVADGMGGHVGGGVASKMAIDEISQFILNRQSSFHESDESDGLKVLANAVNHASTKIYEKALEDPSLKGMGTTATVLKVENATGFIGHVGDSRLYLIRGGFMYQITDDHSLVQEQVRAGILSAEEAESHHLRNVITRSVGYQEEEHVDTLSIRLFGGDRILLCSDGLHGKLSDQEISQMAQKTGAQSVEEFIEEAKRRGGDDNISVIVAEIL